MGKIPGIARQWKATRWIRATQGKFVHGEFAQQNAPGSRRAVVVASSLGTRSAMTRELAVVRISLVSYRSFSAMGIPCRGPRYSPRNISASAVRAAAMALGQDGNVGLQFAVKSFDTIEKHSRQFDRRQLSALQELSSFTHSQVTQLCMCRRHSATSALGVPVGGIDNGEIFRR